MASHQHTMPIRTVIVALAIIIMMVPATYLAAPAVRQWRFARDLRSSDITKRQQALTYLVAHLVDQPDLLDHAIDALTVEDSANFLQIVDALQAANHWTRPPIPDTAYLRWIGLQADQPGTEAPSLAAQRLAGLYDRADDPRLIAILQKLMNSPDADVRYNALCAAAELCASANQTGPYHEMILQAAHDQQPVIAHHAAIFGYLMNIPIIDPPAWLTHLPPEPADSLYDQQAIHNLLVSPEAPLRDVGCVLAVRDLEPQVIPGLIEALLSDTDLEPKLAGAILVGLTDEQTDLLRSTLEAQSDWATSRTMMLGLWMQGDSQAQQLIDPAALLAQGDVPHSTIILAMLHRHDPLAYDVLLNPQGETPADLARLLQDYGWWRVLDQYLPENVPRWQPSDDVQMQQHQIDLLRDWYLVNRERLFKVRE